MNQILTRIGKGSPLTDLELDTTLLAFRTAINAFSASYVPLPTVIPLISGGTNNTLTPNGNRIMISTLTQIVEAAAITPNRALGSDSNGIPINLTATGLEVNYLSGVTSLIQNQINSKEPTISNLPISKGGTGNTTAPINGQLLIGNTSTGGFTLATLSAGTGISIDNTTPGAITISATGSIGTINGLSGNVILTKDTAGTDFGINVSGQNIVFSLPTASTLNRGLVKYTGSSTDFLMGDGNSHTLNATDVTNALTYLPVPPTRILTINGVALDLSVDRSWTVASGSVASSNGFAGTVVDGVINLSTTVTGLIKGDGTTLSAATPGTDYLTPTGDGSGLTGTVTQAGNAFNGANQLIKLTAATKYPALDGSLITGITGIGAGVITNTMVNASAAIALSKLAAVTANKVLLSDASGLIISSSTTNTQLGFLDATSSIQTQLNAKQASLTLGNLTEATSNILTITGGTGSIIGSGLSIQVKQSATAQSGYLSSTDWNTFNGKQTALSALTIHGYTACIGSPLRSGIDITTISGDAGLRALGALVIAMRADFITLQALGL